MGKTRHEVMPAIEGNRASIREHIGKYNDYQHSYDKDFALKTIRRCQDNIRDLKRQCNQSIEDSWEDYWTP